MPTPTIEPVQDPDWWVKISPPNKTWYHRLTPERKRALWINLTSVKWYRSRGTDLFADLPSTWENDAYTTYQSKPDPNSHLDGMYSNYITTFPGVQYMTKQELFNHLDSNAKGDVWLRGRRTSRIPTNRAMRGRVGSSYGDSQSTRYRQPWEQ